MRVYVCMCVCVHVRTHGVCVCIPMSSMCARMRVCMHTDEQHVRMHGVCVCIPMSSHGGAGLSPDSIFSSYAYCTDCMNVPPTVSKTPKASFLSPAAALASSSPAAPSISSSGIIDEKPTKQTAMLITPTPTHILALSGEFRPNCFMSATKTMHLGEGEGDV